MTEMRGGVVMPGDSDWIVVRGDGVWQLDVRLPLQTDDGAFINMAYKGLTQRRDLRCGRNRLGYRGQAAWLML